LALDHLFRPLTIGSTEIRNRIVSAAHQTTLVDAHLPTEDFVAYQAARARGGAGLIVMEAVAVAPSGLLTSHTLGGYLDGMVDGYARVARAVQGEGAALFVQLFHGGREQLASAPRPIALSASAVPSHRYHTEPRALRLDEIEELIAGYARCAAVAAAGGVDGVEISAAHAYLAEQFFTPALNHRADRFAEGPRFLIEVLDAVRTEAPGIVVGVRLSADSAAARAIAPTIAPLVDYLHVALGNSSTFDGCVGIVPPPPAPPNAIAGWTEPFRLGVPLVATSRVLDPDDADRLIAVGAADAFGMTRALITDPDLPEKARAGRTDEILRCIGCNACIAHYHAETPIRCAQNPRTGRERTLPRPERVAGRGRVVVVGAGPAGLAAATEAGLAGHDVVLLERDSAIGGQTRLAGAAPAHRELAAALRGNYERLLGRAGVSLRLGVEADAAGIAALDPELVIVATGARPYAPRAELAGVRVVQAWDVLAGDRPAGHERIVIADWGGDWAGLDCAEVLAAEGRSPFLAVGAVTPGETLHQYERNASIGRLLRAGVTIGHYLGLDGVGEGVVRFRNVLAPELEAAVPADLLVLSLGRAPEDALAPALRALGLRVEEAGDCRGPRGLEEAILEGTLAARSEVATAGRGDESAAVAV
jgi:2,4-dienoyl-CoA reductase-like NADH-dependent reductase (Old Yellow Enzyme family)